MTKEQLAAAIKDAQADVMMAIVIYGTGSIDYRIAKEKLRQLKNETPTEK